MDNKKWFKEAKFGMMAHFGLYSILGGEWKGQRMTDIGEWVQAYFRITKNEYAKLADVFNPIYFDAEEWIKLARDAGMKYFVITAKHHDGFALYKSDVDKFNSVDATPFGRDIIAECAEACKKYGLKLGLYYSQEIDWRHPDGGGWGNPIKNFANTVPWDNQWDFPDISKKNYTRCFEEKIKPQVKEILTKFDDLALIWFDTPYNISPEQSKELYDMVKLYQPDCLVNSRIGNGMGDYESAEDNVVPEQAPGKLFESPCTLNNTWGWKSFDNDWKSAEQIVKTKKHLNDNNMNYLLNVGSDYLGRIPAPAYDILRKVGQMCR